MTDLPVEPVKKTPKTYTDAQKKAIMLSVSTLGVRGAARAANITVSTLSMWRTIARGTGRNDLAPMPPRYGDFHKFDDHTKKAAAHEWVHSLAYNRTTMVCSKYKVNARSLKRWVEQYEGGGM